VVWAGGRLAAEKEVLEETEKENEQLADSLRSEIDDLMQINCEPVTTRLRFFVSHPHAPNLQPCCAVCIRAVPSYPLCRRPVRARVHQRGPLFASPFSLIIWQKFVCALFLLSLCAHMQSRKRVRSYTRKLTRAHVHLHTYVHSHTREVAHT
jgi:hypothetical protein